MFYTKCRSRILRTCFLKNSNISWPPWQNIWFEKHLDKFQLYPCKTMSTRQEYRHPTRWYRPAYSTMVSQFIPRVIFPTLDSLPRSYFLGHHKSGLSRMKTLLSTIDLIIECRDYRVPLASRNPLFEASLAGRERLIVYTKRDLGSNQKKTDLQVRTSRGAGPLESR